MSRRIRNSESEGSLDLLLDTICNTFGGVVFISILVVVLVNVTSETVPIEPPTEQSQAHLVAMEIQRDKTHERLRRLRLTAAQAGRTAKALSNPQSQQLAEQLRNENDTRSRRIQRKSNLVGSVSRAQIQINETARRVATRKQQLKSGRTQLDGLLVSLKTKLKTQSRTMGLPRLRQTTKDPIGFFLKNDRLYAAHTPPRTKYGSPKIGGPDVQIETVGRLRMLRPNANAGVTISNSSQAISRARTKFNRFDPKRHYVKIFVWEDSFKSFAQVRKILVDAGFEYALAPMPKNQKVFIGGRGGDEVQ